MGERPFETTINEAVRGELQFGVDVFTAAASAAVGKREEETRPEERDAFFDAVVYRTKVRANELFRRGMRRFGPPWVRRTVII